MASIVLSLKDQGKNNNSKKLALNWLQLHVKSIGGFR